VDARVRFTEINLSGADDALISLVMVDHPKGVRLLALRRRPLAASILGSIPFSIS
jgi:hypothetical protein